MAFAAPRVGIAVGTVTQIERRENRCRPDRHGFRRFKVERHALTSEKGAAFDATGRGGLFPKRNIQPARTFALHLGVPLGASF
jgi:hypothetical protein